MAFLDGMEKEFARSECKTPFSIEPTSGRSKEKMGSQLPQFPYHARRGSKLKLLLLWQVFSPIEGRQSSFNSGSNREQTETRHTHTHKQEESLSLAFLHDFMASIRFPTYFCISSKKRKRPNWIRRWRQ